MLKTINEKVIYKGYIHLQSFEPEGILDLIDPDADFIKININGILHRININSLRLQCFKKSRRCIKCGLEGTIISVDTFTSKSDRDSTHFNLYAIFEGKTRLMTKDHIIPKSKGGANHLDNLQTMCDQCNHRKGDNIIGAVALFGDSLNIIIRKRDGEKDDS